MNEAISETNRRRAKQLEYNKENNITPQSIIKGVDMELAHIVEADYVTVPLDTRELDAATATIKSEEQLAELLTQLETQMREAAKKFEFEKAAQLRDRIKSLKQQDLAGLFGKERARSSCRPPPKTCTPPVQTKAAAQFVERIKGAAPDDSALAQGNDRRAQHHVREDQSPQAEASGNKAGKRASPCPRPGESTWRSERKLRRTRESSHARRTIRQREAHSSAARREICAAATGIRNCAPAKEILLHAADQIAQTQVPRTETSSCATATPERKPAMLHDFPSFMSSTTSMARRRCVPLAS